MQGKLLAAIFLLLSLSAKAQASDRVEVFGGIRIERRRQDAAIAQRARAELHASVHPGDDAVLIDLGDGGFDQLAGGEQVTEAQLAIFEHLLDLLVG